MAMLATTTKTAPQQARSRSLPESFSLLRRMRVASLAVSEPTDQRIRRPSIYSPNRLRPIFFASRPRTGDQPPQTELPVKDKNTSKDKGLKSHAVCAEVQPQRQTFSPGAPHKCCHHWLVPLAAASASRLVPQGPPTNGLSVA
jgi:hypothetical protein